MYLLLNLKHSLLSLWVTHLFLREYPLHTHCMWLLFNIAVLKTFEKISRKSPVTELAVLIRGWPLFDDIQYSACLPTWMFANMLNIRVSHSVGVGGGGGLRGTPPPSWFFFEKPPIKTNSPRRGTSPLKNEVPHLNLPPPYTHTHTLKREASFQKIIPKKTPEKSETVITLEKDSRNPTNKKMIFSLGAFILS